MRCTRILPLLVLAALLAACEPVPSLQPLYTEEDLMFEPALLGAWGGGKTSLMFEQTGEKAYRVTFVDDENVSQYEAHVFRLGNSLYLDIQPDADALRKSLNNEAGAYLHLLPFHTFYRVTIEDSETEGQQVVFRYIDDTQLRKRIDEGAINIGHQIVNGNLVLTASTADLQALVLKLVPEEEAWESLDPFSRQPTEFCFTNLGRVYEEQERYPEALAAYRKALELNPNSLVALRGRAETLRHWAFNRGLNESGLYAESRAAYQKALELQPNDIEALEGLALTLQDEGRFEEAAASFRKAAALAPDNPDVRTEWGLALSLLGHHDQAREQHGKALRLARDPRQAQRNLAYSYLLEDRPAEAVTVLSMYVETDPGPAVYRLLWLNLSLRELGREAEAQQELERYAELFNDDRWESQLFRYFQGKLTESQLLSYAGTRGEYCEAYFYIGYSYWVQGKQERARECFQKALETQMFGFYEYAVARDRLQRLSSR